MVWGSISEDSTLVIYLKSFWAKNTDNLIVRETGRVLHQMKL